MIVDVATHADVEPLHALIERAYRGDSARAGWTHEADLLSGQRTDVEALKALLPDNRNCILVARRDETVFGCVLISKRDEGIALLGLLSVDPERQAAGVGRALIAAAEHHARTAFGCTSIEMTVIRQRPELIDYYVRRGYALTGETRPFPHGDERFGLPRTPDLSFVVLAKSLINVVQPL